MLSCGKTKAIRLHKATDGLELELELELDAPDANDVLDLMDL